MLQREHGTRSWVRIFCGSKTNKMGTEHMFHRDWANYIAHAPRTARSKHVPWKLGSPKVARILRSASEIGVNGIC